MSAPAHTPSASGEIATETRVLAIVDRALPYLGPAIALVLGTVAAGHRSLDVDEAVAVGGARGSFTDVVERAFEDDPARAGYLALLRPIVAWNDSELWLRLPSAIAAVVAAIAVYRLGRRIAGRYAGAAASILLASSVGVVLLSRSVDPLALALAAMLVSTALFARAVERGNVVWWAVYAVSATILPLTHPIAASALAAQLVALAAARHEVQLRLALPAVGLATIESGLLLVAATLDRRDAVDGAGPLELADIGVGIGRAFGWNPAVAALALWGVIVLYRRSTSSSGRWKPVLVAGLAVMPLLAVLVAGIALPVYPRVALTVAAGGVALAAGIGLVAIPDRNLRLAAGGAAAAVAIAALATSAAADPREDWREAVRVVRAEQRANGTVVVLPERASWALAYYAPDVELTRVGRGDTVTVVVAGDTDLASAAARTVVSPPRYALLEQRNAGRALVVQRWVRP